MTEPIPRDVVPGEITREKVLRWNDAAGSQAYVEIPGQLVEDADGIPLSVGPSRREPAVFDGACLTRSQLDRLGLTPEDVPNIHIIEGH